MKLRIILLTNLIKFGTTIIVAIKYQNMKNGVKWERRRRCFIALEGKRRIGIEIARNRGEFDNSPIQKRISLVFILN